MSYAGSMTSQLLRAAIAGRTGYQEGKILGGKDVASAANAARDDARAQLVAAAQAASANRTAGLKDPNDPDVLASKEAAGIKTHQANRLFDVAHPTRDMSGSTPGSTDKVALRARAAYKAKLMAPAPQRFGPPRPGMSEAEAEELATSAYGPAEGRAADAPNTSTQALMSGSILRGGGAAAASRGGSSTSSAPKATGAVSATKTSSAPANDPKLNVSGGKKKGNIDLSAAAPAATAIPTGTNLKERDMDPADLWDKKVREGMTPVQATAYVKRMKGTG